MASPTSKALSYDYNRASKKNIFEYQSNGTRVEGAPVK